MVVAEPAGAAVTPASHAPGPRGNLLAGSIFDMQRQGQLPFYVDTWRQYGDVVRYRLGPLTAHLIVRPEHVEHVLVRNVANYEKGIGYAKVKALLGDGLLTSEGDFWHRQRRLMQPPFTPRAVVQFAPLIVRTVQEMLERWQQAVSAGLDVNAEMIRLAATIIGRTMLGVDVGDEAQETGRAFAYVLKFAAQRTIALVDIPLFVPTPANRQFKEAMGILDALVYRLIAERRRAPDDQADLLSILFNARDEATGGRMTERQLRDEVLVVFLAGHETTALALSWAWMLLAQHPEAEGRLHQEIDTVLGGRAPTVEHLHQLEYTAHVIDEVLRLYPPVWTFPRSAKADDQVGGYHIPKGSLLLTSPYITQRHPEFWDAPDAFDPDRFTVERAAGRPRYAYYPFGAGPRTCIGNNFALLEAALVLATVAQRYRLRLVPGQDLAPAVMGTLRPRSGIKVIVEAR